MSYARVEGKGDDAMMTVAMLRKALEGLPDGMTVILEIARDESSQEPDDLVQSNLFKADVECRCDEVDRLYLYGDADHDNYHGNVG